MSTIRRALVSVSDKTGIAEFCQQLRQYNIDILSTGGTAALLREHDIPVIDVSDYTGFPEIMDGRVKTLHPKVHGALLARNGVDNATLAEHNITPIDLVVINLYPFEQTIANRDCDLAAAIENIDIGGPTMLRAAAKNAERVTVISDVNEYDAVLANLAENKGETTLEQRRELAQKAFAHTAHYDSMIASYLANQASDTTTAFPDTYTISYQKKYDLRYGENPHQQGAFYQTSHLQKTCIATCELLQGKALSYNNIADADAALECVRQFTGNHACVIVKHANPCGVALADDQTTAYERAYSTDSTSAFGGIIALNQLLTMETAETIIGRQFVEVIIAPGVDPAAAEMLQQKPNVRVLICGELSPVNTMTYDYHRVNGGLLVQERDIHQLSDAELEIVTEREPKSRELHDLLFAWQVAKSVKSNAIVYAHKLQTVGIGAGQMSRVDSAKIATLKAQDAGLSLEGAVMASDAFFPFRDAVDTAAQAGITAIIQPGGSIRDQEVIQATNEANIAMVLTHIRHFKH